MEDPLEGVTTTPGLPDAAGGAAAPRAASVRPAMRAAQLWKLLGDSPSSSRATDTPVTAAVTEPETPSKSWAGDELGELLARAWYETVDGEAPKPSAPADDWSQPATWEVESLPSASEGGIAALFGGAPPT